MILEKINNNDVSKTNPVVVITAFFWLIAKLISYKLWTSNRLFPLAPAFEFLNDLPLWYHLLFYYISICCLVVSMLRPAIIVVFILFLSELFSCMADQNRWQPWEYQYLFIILMLLLNRKHLNYFIPAVGVIIISIYFYSGISKLNNGFLQSSWSNLLLQRFFGITNVTSINSPVLYYLGYGIGGVEIACAVGLIFKKSKKIAAGILIGVHCFNLLLLGPLGVNYNKIVWPWNFAMIGYLYFIFLQFHKSYDLVYPLKKGWNKLVIICWGILPMLYYFNCWDTYLSSVLYSGNIKEMIICVKNSNDAGAKELAPYYANENRKFCEGDKMIMVTKWALDEMNVPMYPEKRIYLQIKKSFNQKYPTTASQFFILYRHKKEELK